MNERVGRTGAAEARVIGPELADASGSLADCSLFTELTRARSAGHRKRCFILAHERQGVNRGNAGADEGSVRSCILTPPAGIGLIHSAPGGAATGLKSEPKGRQSIARGESPWSGVRRGLKPQRGGSVSKAGRYTAARLGLTFANRPARGSRPWLLTAAPLGLATGLIGSKVTQSPMATTSRPKRGVPEGLWIRCPQCKATIFRKEAESRFNVCPECQYHFYLPARERIRQLLDSDSFEEWFIGLRPRDVLGFEDRVLYAERLKTEQAKTGMSDAAVVGRGYIRGRPVVFGLTDFAFMAGSMGSVVGEKLTRAAEEATRLKLPLILVSGSGGGARMQEGILSLMQMAKVSAALARYDQAGGLYISILTNPTMGGVAASFALQGDITLAEPGALIGFAGKRTIWNTVRLELPEGFQTSEFLLQHGFIDRIVPRSDLRTEVARLIDYCEH